MKFPSVFNESEFKSDLVKDFLSNTAVVFDDKREENLKEKLAEERKEKEEYSKRKFQLPLVPGCLTFITASRV